MVSRRVTRSRRFGGSHHVFGFALIAVSVVVAALLVRPAANRQTSPATIERLVGNIDAVEVPVALEVVPAGTRAKDIRVVMRSFPVHFISPETIRSREELTNGFNGFVATVSLPAGQPINSRNLSDLQQSSNPVLERIPDGMRAISIKVDATAAVEGWAGAGTTVDVFLLSNDRTSVVAEQVKILSLQRNANPIDSKDGPGDASTATILVTQEQALAVSTAQNKGKLTFALRSMRDETAWRQTVFTSAQLEDRHGTGAKAKVTGAIKFQSETGVKTFAISNGRLVPTDVVPNGWLTSTENPAPTAPEGAPAPLQPPTP